jgi:hypothetical protein
LPDDCAHIHRLAVEFFAQPRQRFIQAPRLDGLEQIVDRARVERIDGVLVVGGDEHHVCLAADALGYLQARQAGHADIQKHHARHMLQIGVPGIEAIVDRRDHLRLGPGQRQHAEQALAHQRFVFGDQDCDCHCASLRGMRSSASRPGSASLSARLALSP